MKHTIFQEKNYDPIDIVRYPRYFHSKFIHKNVTSEQIEWIKAAEYVALDLDRRRVNDVDLSVLRVMCELQELRFELEGLPPGLREILINACLDQKVVVGPNLIDIYTHLFRCSPSASAFPACSIDFLGLGNVWGQHGDQFMGKFPFHDERNLFKPIHLNRYLTRANWGQTLNFADAFETLRRADNKNIGAYFNAVELTIVPVARAMSKSLETAMLTGEPVAFEIVLTYYDENFYDFNDDDICYLYSVELGKQKILCEFPAKYRRAVIDAYNLTWRSAGSKLKRYLWSKTLCN